MAPRHIEAEGSPGREARWRPEERGKEKKLEEKSGPLPSDLSTSVPHPCTVLKGAGFLLYPVLQASTFLSGIGQREWSVGGLMGMGWDVGGAAAGCAGWASGSPCSEYSPLFTIPYVATVDELKVALRTLISQTYNHQLCLLQCPLSLHLPFSPPENKCSWRSLVSPQCLPNPPTCYPPSGHGPGSSLQSCF